MNLGLTSLSVRSLQSLKWLDLKDNPLDPALAKVAGDCLDEKQCKQCANKVSTKFPWDPPLPPLVFPSQGTCSCVWFPALRSWGNMATTSLSGRGTFFLC